MMVMAATGALVPECVAEKCQACRMWVEQVTECRLKSMRTHMHARSSSNRMSAHGTPLFALPQLS